jgi:hypothetical protein
MIASETDKNISPNIYVYMGFAITHPLVFVKVGISIVHLFNMNKTPTFPFKNDLK